MKPNTQAATGGQRKSASRSEPLGVNTEIGRKLKQYYDELVSEDVPDKFADLLKQLEDRETPSSTSNEGN
ncbi:NepR family anti-sigma factor [Mesorhizobium sp. CAU 1741]|uniref:NepR family anti-sigma factor n=1 Tax=Mesorhizobium sp. CAU 1741 TaxID=3140366 RepID=UPI00325A94FD